MFPQTTPAFMQIHPWLGMKIDMTLSLSLLTVGPILISSWLTINVF